MGRAYMCWFGAEGVFPVDPRTLFPHVAAGVDGREMWGWSEGCDVANVILGRVAKDRGEAIVVPTGSRAYVVRDAEAGPGEVTHVYPYTLKGLTEALDEARFLSMGGEAQVLAVIVDGRSTVIRKFEGGREVPVT